MAQTSISASPTENELPQHPSTEPAKEQIRLLIVLSRYWPGFSGAAQQQHDVLKRLGPGRVNATVLTLRTPGLSWRDTLDSVRILRLGTGKIHRHARLLFAIQTFLYVLLRGRSYHVIHSYAAGWAGFLVPLAAKLVAVPSVYSSTLQGADDALTIRSQSWGKLKLRMIRLCQIITTYTPRQADAFIQAGFSAESVITLTCGVDERYYFPGRDEECRRELRKAAGRDDEGPVVLFIGTLTRRKGIDLLVGAFRLMLARHPTAVLILMGPKNQREDATLDESFVQSIRVACETAELKNHVAMLGRIDSVNRKRSILRASDVLALFSQNEGLGIVVLEAMACGVPPVLTPIPGVFDYMVDDGTNGRIAASLDLSELSDTLHEVLSSTERRKAMGSKARDAISRRFSLTAIASQYFRMYHRLAHRGGPRSGKPPNN